MTHWIVIFLGGGLGSMARYLVAKVQFHYFGSFPLGTFLANFISCIILGILIGIFSNHTDVDEKLRLALVVGFCGGFSTFSTFSLESFELLHQGQIGMLLLYLLASLLVCVLSIWGGMAVGKLF